MSARRNMKKKKIRPRSVIKMYHCLWLMPVQTLFLHYSNVCVSLFWEKHYLKSFNAMAACKAFTQAVQFSLVGQILRGEKNTSINHSTLKCSTLTKMLLAAQEWHIKLENTPKEMYIQIYNNWMYIQIYNNNLMKTIIKRIYNLAPPIVYKLN